MKYYVIYKNYTEYWNIGYKEFNKIDLAKNFAKEIRKDNNYSDVIGPLMHVKNQYKVAPFSGWTCYT